MPRKKIEYNILSVSLCTTVFASSNGERTYDQNYTDDRRQANDDRNTRIEITEPHEFASTGL
jgi:hypothetical protein